MSEDSFVLKCPASMQTTDGERFLRVENSSLDSWSITFGSSINIVRKIGGRDSSFGELYDFLDKSERKITAGISESYLSLFNFTREVGLELLIPFRIERKHIATITRTQNTSRKRFLLRSGKKDVF